MPKSVKGFEKAAFEKLRDYYWHGNLRELRNVIKRSVLLCQDKKIKQMHLPSEIITPTLTEDSSLSVSFNGGIPGNLKTVAEEAEKKAIIETLRLTNNNKSKTAELLEVDRKTLYNKLKSYNIET
jgi:two-component system response regulator HydG